MCRTRLATTWCSTCWSWGTLRRLRPSCASSAGAMRSWPSRSSAATWWRSASSWAPPAWPTSVRPLCASCSSLPSSPACSRRALEPWSSLCLRAKLPASPLLSRGLQTRLETALESLWLVIAQGPSCSSLHSFPAGLWICGSTPLSVRLWAAVLCCMPEASCTSCLSPPALWHGQARSYQGLEVRCLQCQVCISCRLEGLSLDVGGCWEQVQQQQGTWLQALWTMCTAEKLSNLCVCNVVHSRQGLPSTCCRLASLRVEDGRSLHGQRHQNRHREENMSGWGQSGLSVGWASITASEWVPISGTVDLETLHVHCPVIASDGRSLQRLWRWRLACRIRTPTTCCRARWQCPQASCTWTWWTPSGLFCPPCGAPPTASASCPRSTSSCERAVHAWYQAGSVGLWARSASVGPGWARQPGQSCASGWAVHAWGPAAGSLLGPIQGMVPGLGGQRKATEYVISIRSWMQLQGSVHHCVLERAASWEGPCLAGGCSVHGSWLLTRHIAGQLQQQALRHVGKHTLFSLALKSCTCIACTSSAFVASASPCLCPREELWFLQRGQWIVQAPVCNRHRPEQPGFLRLPVSLGQGRQSSCGAVSWGLFWPAWTVRLASWQSDTCTCPIVYESITYMSCYVAHPQNMQHVLHSWMTRPLLRVSTKTVHCPLQCDGMLRGISLHCSQHHAIAIAALALVYCTTRWGITTVLVW